MKKIPAPAVLSILVTTASFAQLTSLPPSALEDGIPIHSPLDDPRSSSWQTSALADYRVSADHPFSPPPDGSADRYGRIWVSQAPSRDAIVKSGGTIRVIFLGSTEGQLDGVGYTLTGNPAGPRSFTLASSAGGTSESLAFGGYADLPFSVNAASAFDLWCDSRDATFCLFSSASRLPSTNPGQVLWTESPIPVSTYIPSLNTTSGVSTWIASVTEPPAQAEGVSVSYRIAVQFFPESGGPLAPTTPVPEPSSYGSATGLTLAAGVLARRLFRKR